MKSKEKKVILILVVITIIIAILVKVKNASNEKLAEELASKDDVVSTEDTDKLVEDEFIDVASDGTRVNTSSKLAETKKVGDYEVSNIQLTELNGQSTLLADVKNTGSDKKDVTLIDITLLDKEGEEISTIGGIVGDIEPGETTQLNASVTTNVANAYDFTIKISESTIPTE